MTNAAWPVEEVWLRPIATLAIAAFLPFVTARALAALTLPARLPDDPREAARLVAPFRAGAMIVGVVQIQLAWMIGASALGPALVEGPAGAASVAFAAGTAILTFVLGAPARAIENATPRGVGARRTSVASQMLLRLRMVPWLAGPVIVATAASTLPLVDPEGHVDLPFCALALVVTFVGVALAGPLLSVSTLALRPATEKVRALAQRVARREGVPLFAVLRLPTHGVRFANAAALPWARTMIVTDHITELLGERELEAVLAHEAGHLSEAAWVSACRLGVVGVLLFTSSSGVAIAESVSRGSSSFLLAALLVVALPTLRALLGLARRMEERADAHARDAVSPDALADALLALADDAGVPLVTGRGHARLHPDLYDRIVACGRDLGPRPEAPQRRAGLVAGVIVSVGLVALPAVAVLATRIEAGGEANVGARAATWRLRVDPWDPSAMLALAWAAASDADPDLARARAAEATRLGANRAELLELDAELLAAAGRCDEARARFDEALSARASERFALGRWEPVELGGYHLPPSLVTECGYGE